MRQVLLHCLQKRAPEFHKIWCHYSYLQISTPRKMLGYENHFTFSAQHLEWFHMVCRFSGTLESCYHVFDWWILRKRQQHSVKKTISHFELYFVAVDESLRCKPFCINCNIKTIEEQNALVWMFQTHIVPYSNWLMFRCACWT